MEQIITTTVVTLISGAIGAIIGTYGGALFAAKRQEKHIKELRQVAIKALKIFQKYARNRQTYDVAASEFNNALSIASNNGIVKYFSLDSTISRKITIFTTSIR